MCRNIITLPNHPAVTEQYRGAGACTTCYRALTVLLPKGQGCEVCGGPAGYRNLRDPAGLYKCHECHVAAGTAALWTVSPP
jgi:hypothetical protein